MNDDTDLLRSYAEKGDEEAFAALVQRHVNLVYTVALRQANGDAHLAADAAQLVFTDLARKASRLLGHRVLAAWLFTSTRFAAAKLVRGEQRRHAREQEAQLMHALNESDDPAAQLDWQRVRPVLDEVIGELAEPDREAILLRFFEGRDYAGIGEKLNLAHNAARMRVERALEKLRARLERRGVRSTSAALATALAHQAVLAAPAGLAATVTCAALAGGTTLAVTAGAGAAGVTFMSMTKLQLGLAGALAVAGATGFVVQADTNATLRAEVAALRRESTTIDALKTGNRQLARNIADAADLRGDDAELARLQQEATALRARQQQVAQQERQRALEQGAVVYDISALDRTPVPRFQARPQYPAAARRAGIGGEVVVDFVVDNNGDVKKARAIRSALKPETPVVKLAPFTVATSGSAATAPMDPATLAQLQSEMEAAAEEAIGKWKFKPGIKGGRDVATHMRVPIVFTVSGK